MVLSKPLTPIPTKLPRLQKPLCSLTVSANSILAHTVSVPRTEIGDKIYDIERGQSHTRGSGKNSFETCSGDVTKKTWAIREGTGSRKFTLSDGKRHFRTSPK